MELYTFTCVSPVAMTVLKKKMSEGVDTVHFGGDLDNFRHRVDITIFGSYDKVLEDGTRTSWGRNFTLASIDSLPGCERQNLERTNGILWICFEAKVHKIRGNKITVELPEYYHDKYKPSNVTLYDIITEQIPEKDGVAAMRIRTLTYSLLGIKDEITVYPSIADFKNDCYDLTEFEKVSDELDAKNLAVCIKDMYYNSIALCKSKYYRYKSFWADWDLYGYDIKDVPLEKDFLLRTLHDTAFCNIFYNSDFPLDDFLELSEAQERLRESPTLLKRLERVVWRREKGYHP